MTSNSELLSVNDVAKMLGVSAQTVRIWADAGAVPVYDRTIRGQRIFKRVDIERYARELLASRATE